MANKKFRNDTTHLKKIEDALWKRSDYTEIIDMTPQEEQGKLLLGFVEQFQRLHFDLRTDPIYSTDDKERLSPYLTAFLEQLRDRLEKLKENDPNEDFRRDIQHHYGPLWEKRKDLEKAGMIELLPSRINWLQGKVMFAQLLRWINGGQNSKIVRKYFLVQGQEISYKKYSDWYKKKSIKDEDVQRIKNIFPNFILPYNGSLSP